MLMKQIEKSPKYRHNLPQKSKLPQQDSNKDNSNKNDNLEQPKQSNLSSTNEPLAKINDESSKTTLSQQKLETEPTSSELKTQKDKKIEETEEQKKDPVEVTDHCSQMFLIKKQIFENKENFDSFNIYLLPKELNSKCLENIKNKKLIINNINLKLNDLYKKFTEIEKFINELEELLIINEKFSEKNRCLNFIKLNKQQLEENKIKIQDFENNLNNLKIKFIEIERLIELI